MRTIQFYDGNEEFLVFQTSEESTGYECMFTGHQVASSNVENIQHASYVTTRFVTYKCNKKEGVAGELQSSTVAE